MSAADLSTRATRLGRQFRWALALYILVWFVWQALSIPQVHALAPFRGIPWRPLFFVGGSTWLALFLLLITLYVRIMRDRRVRGMLSDELTRRNFNMAFMIGYWCLLIALGVVLFVVVKKLGEPIALLRGLIIFGATVPMTIYLWLQREP